MRGADRLFDAITGVKETLIDEAIDFRFKRRIPWARYATIAACLALALFAGRFALVFLEGGMGGSDSGSSNDANYQASADTAAPEGSENAGGMSGGSTEDSTGAATEGDGGTGDGADTGGGSAVQVFTATVLEVHETYLLVEPAEGEELRSTADRIEVPYEGLPTLPLTEGSLIQVTFSGPIQETYPARVTGVQEILWIE